MNEMVKYRDIGFPSSNWFSDHLPVGAIFKIETEIFRQKTITISEESKKSAYSNQLTTQATVLVSGGH